MLRDIQLNGLKRHSGFSAWARFRYRQHRWNVRIVLLGFSVAWAFPPAYERAGAVPILACLRTPASQWTYAGLELACPGAGACIFRPKPTRRVCWIESEEFARFAFHVRIKTAVLLFGNWRQENPHALGVLTAIQSTQAHAVRNGVPGRTVPIIRSRAPFHRHCPTAAATRPTSSQLTWSL